MTPKEKDLILKDLCARLPYIVFMTNIDLPETHYPLTCQDLHNAMFDDDWDDVPYLRPMSSMTAEEFEELKEYSGLKYEQLNLASYQNGTYKCLDFYLSEVPSYVVILVFDWLNAHHFDYRELIEKGLAIAVTDENNPYKD